MATGERNGRMGATKLRRGGRQGGVIVTRVS